MHISMNAKRMMAAMATGMQTVSRVLVFEANKFERGRERETFER